MSCEPRLLIADEPTSTACDLTIQAQYLSLLRDLQREHGLALIFITHNLGIVARMCDQLAVMSAGRVVEYGPVSRIFDTQAHPYTEALLSWMLPRMSDSRKRLTAIDGQPPDLSAMPPGCAFAPRCTSAFDRCREEAPPEFNLNDGRTARCWLASVGVRTALLMVVLEAAGLSEFFQARRGVFGGSGGVVRAVDNLVAQSRAGETLGVVGKSGCGKTTTAKLVLGLEEPTGGSIRFEDRDLQELDTAGRRHYRKSVQAVFQDPYASLSPRMRISDIIAEPLVTNEVVSASGVRKRVLQLLDLVGLAQRSADLFPHEFSGEQRQRIAIARALALSRKLMRLDEPVSALDVSIRAQILNLLRDLQEQMGLSYLFIAHDLAAVAHMSHTIVVMYLGKIVEIGDAHTLARTPKHPYTEALFSAALPSHPDERREEIILPGEVPSPLNPPSGCRFHPRCPHAMAVRSAEPALTQVEGRTRSPATCSSAEAVARNRPRTALRAKRSNLGVSAYSDRDCFAALAMTAGIGDRASNPRGRPPASS